MLADRIIAEQQRKQQAAQAAAAPTARPIGNARAQELARLLQNDNVKRTLQMIRTAEGTQRFAEPEKVNFGNSRNDDLTRHPNIARPFNNRAGGPNATTATGAYQFIGKTWNTVANQLALPDFSRQSQDIAALELIRQRGGLDAAMKGDVPRLARVLGNEWASLGHNNYRQPTKSVGYLQQAFNAPLADGGTSLAYRPDSGGKQLPGASMTGAASAATAPAEAYDSEARLALATNAATKVDGNALNGVSAGITGPSALRLVDPTQQFFVDQLKLLQAAQESTRLSDPTRLASQEYGA